MSKRALSQSYVKILTELENEKKEQKNSADYKLKRAELLSTLTEEFKNTPDNKIKEKLESVKRNDMLGEKGWINNYSYSQIYHSVIWSPKFLKSQSLLKDKYITDYDNLNEVKLIDTMKLRYKEYKNMTGNWGE